MRNYQSKDCAALARLFYETVHTVNLGDYTQEQVNAWATGQVDLEAWDRTLSLHFTLVAEEAGEIIGFGDMDESGYLDRLYVHREHQRRGVATALCGALEVRTAASVYSTHASVTALPFFERRGYRVVTRQQVERRGVSLTNFVMEKRL